MSASAAVEAQPVLTTAGHGAKITRLGGLKLRIKLPPKHPGLPASSPGPDGSQQPSTSGRSSIVHSSPSGAAAPATAGNGVASAAAVPSWDLSSAVAQMRNQGITGLGETLLSPWHHTQLEPLKQDNKRARDATAVPASAAVPTAKRQRLEGKGAAYAATALEAAIAAAEEAGKPASAARSAGATAARPGSTNSRQPRAVLTEDDFGQPAAPPSSSPAHSSSPVHRQQQKRSQGSRARRRTALQLEDDEDEEVAPSPASKPGPLPPKQQAQQAASQPSSPQQQQHHAGVQQEQGPMAQASADSTPLRHAAQPATGVTAKRKSPAQADVGGNAPVADVAPPPKCPRSAPDTAATAAPAPAPAAATAAAPPAPAAVAAPAAPCAPATALQVATAAQDEPAPSAVVDSRPQPAAAPTPQEQQQQQQPVPEPAQRLLADSPAPVAVALAPAAPANSQQLYDFGPLPLSAAAAALSAVSLVPPKLERKSIAYITSVGEALPFLDALQDAARKLKKSGDKGVHANHHWDVRSLAYYTLSGITFIEYAGYHAALQTQLRASGALVDGAGRPGVLPNMSPLLLQQTADMLNVAVGASSTAQGSDLAKQGIRVLMERLMAICHMRHLQQHQHHLRSHVQRVKQGVRAAQVGAAPLPSAPQQRQAAVPPATATHTKGGQMAVGSSGKRRSPDDSLQSTQERLPDQQPSSSHQQSAGSSRVAPSALLSGGAALTAPLPPGVLASQSHLVSAMQQALRMTDLMHQTVMRLQQFLERPEVQACADAKQAAVHISAVGLDAGMYSIDHVAAHARAAVRCLLSLDVSAARASAGGARRGV